MVKLSFPRFYVEIGWNFDITCKSGGPNLFSVFQILLYFFEDIEKAVSGNYSSGKLSTPRKNYKIWSIFFKKPS